MPPKRDSKKSTPLPDSALRALCFLSYPAFFGRQLHFLSTSVAENNDDNVEALDRKGLRILQELGYVKFVVGPFYASDEKMPHADYFISG
jgi:hypothetical protein